MRRSRESGQVLVTGVVMMAIVLLLVLYAFDVHNVIRAKLKIDIAQQAAAMTGANWQKESLNLIGEINLLKASALLMEGSDNWKTPLPDKEKDENLWRREMQARVDLLTEMQTRVSFVGPLVGFSAAQQSAKNNGLTRIQGALDTYLELLKVDKRYDEAQGGAPKLINKYAWKEPYISMVSRINDNGIAVFPNARAAGMPETRPRELANPKFYSEIMRCAAAIAANDPPKYHYWTIMRNLLKTMDDPDFRGKWWHINYDHNRFPNESEIFTLGVEFGGTYDEKDLQAMENLRNDLEFYADPGSLPAQMKWCIYDLWWLPEYYNENFPDYEIEYYAYWFKGGVLRKEVKPQHIYEGPASYVEGYADVKSRIKVRPSVRLPLDSYGRVQKKDARKAIRSKRNSILTHRGDTITRVGTRREKADDSDMSTGYRPGSIAKVLGELKDDTAPIALDIILPVFKQVSPMPTYMPIPYGFQVLKPGYSSLEKFLNWLAEQQTLDGVPPDGTQHYLDALRIFAYGIHGRARGNTGPVDIKENSSVKGEAFRYYGYNHKFNKSAFDNEFKEKLWKWHDVREERAFQQKVTDGPGRLQEPQLFSREETLKKGTYRKLLEEGEKPKYKDSRIEKKTRKERWEINTVYKYEKKLEEGEKCKYKNSKVATKEVKETWEIYDTYFITSDETEYHIDKVTHKIPMPDNIHGGTAHRVYLDINERENRYYVIDSRGEIVLDGEPDPTLRYNKYTPPNSGGDMHYWNPGRYDGDRGPKRI